MSARWVAIVMLIALAAGTAQTQAPRRRAVITAFIKATGYPNGRPGYFVDHVIPLCAGGPDTLANLQWQERQASYRKDVFERQICAAMKRHGLIMVKR